ncbi:hypothetical protein G7Y31_06805 [Corynebacterium lizhenjunii]|uniref:Uncharacterized protein n=1 Tax=Corynebacterium lizhenjunii TaxID=2709394 RepID=A0A7T0KDV5_9CORY|nr:hypothetical protein [Corynebacterium lizhenjunii]QPK78294.1 hypothetical protein G7Y31_06805 [Corynebacterium lizhenjunii]
MKPSDMPPRRSVYENPMDETRELRMLANQAVMVMNQLVSAGLSEDTALELTIHTLNRFDGEEEY